MEYILESLKMGLWPAVIITIYLIITKIIDTRKTRIEAEKTHKVNKEVIDSFKNLNEFLTYITKDIIEKENDKFQFAIANSFKAAGYIIIKFSTFTIISNNVGKNHRIIEDNIQHCVNAEFSNIINSLIPFNTIKTKVTELINTTWKQEIIDDLNNIIFDEKCSKEERIYNITNKINMRINDYITIVTRNAFK